ncbi:hypothetical protein D1164_21170 [Mariniphaga sediminis]|uniref:beta-fructofuranosidase n=1 Tax=Mariniphaga sediminis TaxID=1628158 RepID=A0A399CXK2_9BACT|nr:glycoside hydrolase family 32 protein [Mariniphaga sediminis]RIH63121.1 hypothetical protein D1164_21170 [Mariniphaga sediminis]
MLKKKMFLICLLLVQMHIAVSAQEDSISNADIEAARKIRKIELEDPIRPTWHLTIPEGKAHPFDPNGAIFKDGVYHLWYIYQANGEHRWQHVSSIDLFHWRWHSNDLQPTPNAPENGIYSGNAFFDKDSNIVIAYYGLGTKGNCIAVNYDEDLNLWKKLEANPIVTESQGDPHMWLEGDTYYQIARNLPRNNPPLLFKGTSYDKPLEKVGYFMSHDMPDAEDDTDISCADFFKMEDKWVLLCISHTHGARYYIGNWDGKQFTPESHHRMNWPGGTFFAPESLIDNKGRRIFWAWILDRKTGSSSGTMSMPRVITLAEDKLSLNIEPPKEIELLRYNAKEEKPFEVSKEQRVTLEKTKGNILEIDMTINPGQAKRFGIKVFCSKDGREETPIIIDLNRNTIQIGMESSSLSRPDYFKYVMRTPNPVVTTQEAPFILQEGEKVHLRIFLDKSIMEVFANNRQCITQVIYPTLKDAIYVRPFTEDAPIKIENIQSWKLFPAMQW